MKRLILLVALVMAMAVLAPAAFADDEGEGADVEMEERDPSAAQELKARMIADYFAEEDGEATEDEFNAVMDLRMGAEDGHKIGWGVLYKLMLYAGSDGFDPDDFEGGWAIGQLKKDYDGDIDLHKNNLGQAQKAAKEKPEKPEKVMPPQANKNGAKHDG